MPTDLRARELAKIAVQYSIAVKSKEKVIISGGQEALPFLTELYKELILRGAYPIVKVGLPNINDFFYKYAKEHQLKFFPQHWFDTVKQAQAYIGVNTEENTRSLTSTDSKKISIRQKIMKPISQYINNEKDKIRRVTVVYPCLSHAQEAEMSLTEWENFVYKSCLIDWRKFSKKLDKINKKFTRGKEVWLKGRNVNLKFSIQDKNSVAGKGKENMPDGEIFMAPVKESLRGEIKFEYPSLYSGKEVTDIYLKFENGKVVGCDASKNKDLLKAVLEADENSSYVGEFGIGCNPNITKFTKNLLFDEKISGTIHLALGMAYKECGGGNDSAIHWDIVKDMRQASIILDGKIVQKNGKWRI
jgi:aminopeptidase